MSANEGSETLKPPYGRSKDFLLDFHPGICYLPSFLIGV